MTWKILMPASLLLAACLPAQAQDVAKPPQAAQGAVQPDEAHMQAEVRCLSAYLAIAGVSGSPAQMAAFIGTFYWFGRVDGHVPPAELEDRLAAEFDALSKLGVLQSEANRCGDEMKQRSDAMMAIGKDLQGKMSAPQDAPKDDKAP